MAVSNKAQEQMIALTGVEDLDEQAVFDALHQPLEGFPLASLKIRSFVARTLEHAGLVAPDAQETREVQPSSER